MFTERELTILDARADRERTRKMRARARRGDSLVCIECGVRGDRGTLGWRAYRADFGEILVYCPGCAEREFGDGAAE